MSDQNFINAILDDIRPAQLVLDLGAGDGRFAEMFAERDAHVTAVDLHPPELQNPKITSTQTKIEDFCTEKNSQRYDLIFARNSIQFLDKPWVLEELFPWMEEHASRHGVIAIETFYQNPEPPFLRPLRSLYTLEELQRYFFSWGEIYARQYRYAGLDLEGQHRTFFVSSMIIQRTHLK